jgi:hypothetical protein
MQNYLFASSHKKCFVSTLNKRPQDMKKIQLLVLLVIIAVTTYAQAPTWQWAKSAGGIFVEEGTGVDVDAAGNTYITGFYSSPNSGPYNCTFGDSTITSVNGNDLFIAKYDVLGTLVWVRSVGGTGDDRGRAITVDAGGNIFVTGHFSSPTITFDTITLTSTSADLFIAKYNTAGRVIWAKSAVGNNASEYSQSIAIDNTGSAYITGYYYSASVVFDTITLTNPYTTTGGYKYFVARYDINGNVAWAKTVQGANNIGNGINVDGFGNSYVTGTYMGAATFNTFTLTSKGSNDFFTVKYDGLGNVLWAQTAGGSSADVPNGISIDGSGNSYVAGYFKSNPVTVGTITLTASGAPDGDMLLIKYNAAGAVQWAKKAYSYSNDAALAIATDATGNSYVAGYYNGSSITFTTGFTLNSPGATTAIGDMFVVKYNTAGTVQWVKNLMSSLGAWGNSIALDANSNLYFTGFFGDPSLSYDGIILNAIGTREIFVGKMGSSGTVGLLEQHKNKNISIYPNPFSHQTMLESEVVLQNATLTIQNCLGQTVKELKHVSGHTITIPRDGLESGMYLITLIQGSKLISTEKLVITD